MHTMSDTNSCRFLWPTLALALAATGCDMLGDDPEPTLTVTAGSPEARLHNARNGWSNPDLWATTTLVPSQQAPRYQPIGRVSCPTRQCQLAIHVNVDWVTAQPDQLAHGRLRWCLLGVCSETSLGRYEFLFVTARRWGESDGDDLQVALNWESSEFHGIEDLQISWKVWVEPDAAELALGDTVGDNPADDDHGGVRPWREWFYGDDDAARACVPPGFPCEDHLLDGAPCLPVRCLCRQDGMLDLMNTFVLDSCTADRTCPRTSDCDAACRNKGLDEGALGLLDKCIVD